MRTLSAFSATVAVAAAVLCMPALPQDASSQAKGLPPRATPSDYQGQAKAGDLTVAAEFMGHSVPTPDGIYGNDDYVVVEVGLFGRPNAKARISLDDFSLRINGSKKPLSSQPYELAFKSLKDPEWQPPKAEKPKTSFGSGGGDGGDATPAPVHMPMELRRAMEQRVQRAAMLEGERALPQAGLLFFEYRGKAKNINSVELLYSGAAGNATVPLHP